MARYCNQVTDFATRNVDPWPQFSEAIFSLIYVEKLALLVNILIMADSANAYRYSYVRDTYSPTCKNWIFRGKRDTETLYRIPSRSSARFEFPGSYRVGASLFPRRNTENCQLLRRRERAGFRGNSVAAVRDRSAVDRPVCSSKTEMALLVLNSSFFT